MHSTFALAAFAAVAYAAPQVTQNIAPTAKAPEGCSASYTGKFQIAAVNVTATHKRDLEVRSTSCDAEGSLTLSLANGILLDAKGRTGYIASNYQFQFDKPAQTGAIYTAGWSTCSNSSLALGGSAIFYQCLSGGFYNLYDRHWAAQCNAITLEILPCAGSSPAPSNGIGQIPDGQPTGTKVGAPVTQISDGQPQATTGVMPVTQIGDGQIQAPPVTNKPAVTQIGDGQIQAPTGTPKAPVTQIGDGQIQAPTGTPKAPVTQIGDGQIQAPTGTPKAPVTQIGDGQIQAPTGTPKAVAPVTQIGDGQIQAPTGTPTKSLAPVTQIGDGQIQAPTGTAAPAPVTQIGDGQVQAPVNGTNATHSTPKPSTTPIEANSGNVAGVSTFAVVVLGAVGAFFL